ncbi:MAG: hypothetical protein BroJett015_45560 [Chloroflexota bacterium]|nr:MAG: hypothetical protein BroJett015_45560 [Chloroflexota bacterium]
MFVVGDSSPVNGTEVPTTNGYDEQNKKDAWCRNGEEFISTAGVLAFMNDLIVVSRP